MAMCSSSSPDGVEERSSSCSEGRSRASPEARLWLGLILAPHGERLLINTASSEERDSTSDSFALGENSTVRGIKEGLGAVEAS